MPGLIIEHLTKSFDGQVVLDDFNIEVDAGNLLVVLGPSGCGKSTLLRLISGLEEVDHGKILLDGRDITDLEPQRRNINRRIGPIGRFPGRIRKSWWISPPATRKNTDPSLKTTSWNC